MKFPKRLVEAHFSSRQRFQKIVFATQCKTPHPRLNIGETDEEFIADLENLVGVDVPISGIFDCAESIANQTDQNTDNQNN
ncbi:hypothetical protein D3C77_461370 [compost metagenome]